LALGLTETGQGDTIYVIDANLFKTKEDLLKNIEACGFQGRIVTIFNHSAGASKGWKYPLKLIWVDTDGNYFSAKSDFVLWEPYLVKGGLIAFGCAGSEDIKKFVKECIVGSGRFKNIETIGSIIVACKDKDTPLYPLWKTCYVRMMYSLYFLTKRQSYILRNKLFFYWLKKDRLKKIIKALFERLA
jgi:hypothetical protein